jgi:serine/threonine-protein kinase
MDTPVQLGKYVITATLGRGAMGVVYKAFDPNIRRVVALKTIRKDALLEDFSANRAARFRNEAQAAGRLGHPGIVAVYDYGEEGDIAYIAMEYVEGHDLADYFKRGVRFEVAHNDLRPFPRERERDAASDTPARSGDQRHFAVKPSHRCPP